MTYFIAPNPYHMARRWAHMAGYEPSRDFNLSVDIREDEAAYILNALVPGLKADDLNIQILDDFHEDVANLVFRVTVDDSEFGLLVHLILELVLRHIERHQLDRQEYQRHQYDRVDNRF